MIWLLVILIALVIILLGIFLYATSLYRQKQKYNKTLDKLKKAQAEQDAEKAEKLKKQAEGTRQKILEMEKEKKLAEERKLEAQEAKKLAEEQKRKEEEARKLAELKKAKAEAEARAEAEAQAQAEAELKKAQAEARVREKAIREKQIKNLREWIKMEKIPNLDSIVSDIESRDNLTEIEILTLIRDMEERGRFYKKLVNMNKVAENIYDIYWIPVDKTSRQEGLHHSRRYKYIPEHKSINRAGKGLTVLPDPTKAYSMDRLFEIFKREIESDGYNIVKRHDQENIVDEDTVDFYVRFDRIENERKIRDQTRRVHYSYYKGILSAEYEGPWSGTTARKTPEQPELTEKHKCGSSFMKNLILRAYNELDDENQARDLILTRVVNATTCDTLFNVYLRNTEVLIKQESRRVKFSRPHAFADPKVEKILGPGSGKLTPIPEKNINNANLVEGSYYFKINDNYMSTWSAGLRFSDISSAKSWTIKKIPNKNSYHLLYDFAGSKRHVFTDNNRYIGRTYKSNKDNTNTHWKLEEKNGKFALYNVKYKAYAIMIGKTIRVSGLNPQYIWSIEPKKDLSEVDNVEQVGIDIDLDNTEPKVFESGKYLLKNWKNLYCGDLSSKYSENEGSRTESDGCVWNLILLNRKSQLYALENNGKYLLNKHYDSVDMGPPDTANHRHVWQILEKDGRLAFRSADTSRSRWLIISAYGLDVRRKSDVNRIYWFNLYKYNP